MSEVQAQEREEEARATAQLEQFRETQRAVFGVDPDVCRND
jgi:hypothetical protein